jgi:hypothetical protein
MKTIQVKLDHTTRSDLHDGLGGVHKHGAVVSLPDDIADQLVAAKLAIFLDGSSAIKATAANKAAQEARIQAARQHSAKMRMELYDTLPKEVRARADEEGDSVIEDYLSSLPSQTIEEFLGEKPKRRGKNGRRLEGEDAN